MASAGPESGGSSSSSGGGPTGEGSPPGATSCGGGEMGPPQEWGEGLLWVLQGASVRG